MKKGTEARSLFGDSRPKKRWEAEEIVDRGDEGVDHSDEVGVQERGDEDDWRIMIGNIGTFPNENDGKGKLKLDLLKQLYTSSDSDMIMLCEHNLNTANITERPQEIMGQWVENSQGRFTEMQLETKDKEWKKRSRYEYGGTGIVTNRKATAHIIASGEDERKMGRWNWVTVKGKLNKATTLISTYKPQNSQRTYERQLAKLRKDGEKLKDAEECWFDDLKKLVEDKSKGDNNVIIGGDFNDDLNNPRGKLNTFMKGLGLREAITHRYGKGPATHNRGSTTIDGLFVPNDVSIEQGGYISEHDSPGDHRFIWADINAGDVVGVQIDNKIPAVTRRATTKIPSAKARFQELYEEKIEQYKLYKKMEQVYDHAVKHKQLDEEHQKLYEHIESQTKKAVKYADKRCRKIKRGKVPFSEKAQKIRGEIEIKKLIIRRILLRGRSGRPRMSKVKRLSRKYKYDGAQSYPTLSEAKNALRIAYKKYAEFRPKAHEFRDTYLGRIATEHAEDDRKAASWHFKRLREQERIKEQARKVKLSEGRGRRVGVTKVDIKQPDGTMKTEFNKDKIEEAIIQANTSKRLQADNTPFRQEPLQSLLGEQMDFDKWQEILQGNIELPEEGIEEGTRLWFEYIKQSNKATPIDITWTTEEYFDSWKKMPETKSCLPGIHTVHIKCMDHTTKGAEIMSKLALIPLLTGYAPRSWKYGIDSMIPKKLLGEHRPEKLRLILLMDARFNHNNKLIGRKMMEYGEKHGLLAEEQYGSRKAKSAIEHALNKRLIIDSTRQTNTECVYIANDAKSCYDRILMMVAYLSMIEMGIDDLVARSSIACILEMEMKIRTTYGDSEITYGGDKWIKLPHGCGQGNGYGPAIWACISSPLLKILKKQGHGAEITSPITLKTILMSAISFVDDTDMIETALRKETWNALMNRTQEGLDLWESLLRTTGGALEPTKSDWVAIRHTWKDGKSKLVTKLEPNELTVRNPAGEREALEQKKSNEARETLGVWQAPDGNEKEQKKQLLEKVEEWRSNTSTSRINRRDTTWAVRTTIGKSIRYPLAATTLTEQQCKQVESKLVKAAYGKMGVVRTAPKYLGAAPKELGGIGVNTGIHENQTIDQIAMTLRHGHTDTATGQLIRAAAENLCIESGISGDPYHIKADEVTWTTDKTWIQNSIGNMQRYSIQLDSHIKGLKEWTSNDGFIMEEALRYIKDKKSRAQFNKVRMYVKAATLSDALTADGKHIARDIYNADEQRLSVTPSSTAYIWPTVPKPSRKEINIWQTTLQLIFSANQEDLKVQTAVDRTWDTKYISHYQWAIGADQEIIYQKQEKEWKIWNRINTTSRKKKYTTAEEITTDLPENIKPCTVEKSNTNIYLQAIGQHEEYHDDESDYTLGWVEPTLTTATNYEESYADRIKHNRGEIVSDGSHKNYRTTSAFVVLPEKEIHGETTIPGEPEDQSSYRGELGGILTSIVYTNKICEKHNITEGKCRMYCDNKGALSASFGWKKPNPRWASYDIVSLIRLHLKKSPIQWEGAHIKGHQDKYTDYDDLDYIAQGNIDADHYANEEMEEYNESERCNIEGIPWHLTFRSKTIAGDIEKRLRIVIHEENMRNVWRNKFELTEEQGEKILWRAFKKNNRNMDERKALWVTKFNQRIGAVKKNLERRGHSEDGICPCCNQMEDTDHIFQCQNNDIQKTFEDEYEKVNTWVENTAGHQTAQAMKALCEAFRRGTEIQLGDTLNEKVQEAAQEQFELGQRAFFGGWWSRKWFHVQQSYAIRNKHRCINAINWMAKAIAKYQDLLRSMWTERNEQLHQKESSDEHKRETEKVDDRIDDIYQQLRSVARSKRMMTRGEQRFFSRTKETIKRKKLRTKQKWTTDAEHILAVYLERTRNGEAMRDFLRYHLRDPG